MPKLILNPLSAKLDYVSTKADLDLSGTNSGDVTVTDTSTIDFTLTGQALTGSVIQSGITHNNLGGLTTGDPHTQYALLAGRSGGQTLIGGTAANDDLTLEGTSSATRTTSYVILQPNGGNVGIGTTSPQNNLDVRGSVNNFSASLARDINLNEWTGLHFGYSEAANNLYRKSAIVFERKDGAARGSIHILNDSVADAGSANLADSKLTIDLNGNVGIGTTSPEAKLQIFSSTVSDALMLSGSSLSNNARKFSGIIGKHYTNTEEPSGIIWYDSNVSSSEVNFGGGTSILNAPTDIVFWAAANTTTTTGTEYLHIYGNGAKVILPNGNVGIGTSAPNAKLEVSGNIYTTNNTNFLLFGTNSGTNPYLQGGADNSLYIGNNNTPKIFVSGSGNVGINDTAASAQLHVDQTSTTAAKPTLRLQQADLSEEFIRFDATVGTGNPINTTALGTYYGRVRVYVEGVGEKWLALYNT